MAQQQINAKFLASPASTLVPYLSEQDALSMAYPPNAMPGARDVLTPFGSMRVYEWGPEDGQKVVFVHGDATPSPLFSKIAQGLVDKGHRVLLFDLWGRGYTDTPLDCRHDARVFASQILFAVSSSAIPWTGKGNEFALIGFSLGCAISMQFAASMPQLVKSVVLLGPAGLIRQLPDSYLDRWLYHPEEAPSADALRAKVRETLEVELSGPKLSRVPGVGKAFAGPSPTSGAHREFSMGDMVQWQFDHHQGNAMSFQETVRYGPLQNQHATYATVCDVIAGKTHSESKLHGSKLLVMFGADDTVVVGKETHEDLGKMLPAERLVVEYLPGGHGFPYPNSEQITRSILRFWGA